MSLSNFQKINLNFFFLFQFLTKISTMQTTKVKKEGYESHFIWRIENLIEIIDLRLHPCAMQSEVQNIPGLDGVKYWLEIDFNQKNKKYRTVECKIRFKLSQNLRSKTPNKKYVMAMRLMSGDQIWYNQCLDISHGSYEDHNYWIVNTGPKIIGQAALIYDVLTLDFSVTSQKKKCFNINRILNILDQYYIILGDKIGST